MNMRCFSGWLHEWPVEAFTESGTRKLHLTVILRDALGHEFPERVMIESPVLLERVEARLAPGCAVVVQGPVCAWPKTGRGGASVGHDRWVVASDIEVTREVQVEAGVAA